MRFDAAEEEPDDPARYDPAQAAQKEVAEREELNWKAALKRTKGTWAGREDLPDFEALRREWDRCWTM